jgi:Mg/Co/Ni transporter MgtE
VRLARKGSIGRRPSYRLVDYDEVPALFGAPSEMQAEAARLRDFHPAEVAAIVRALPDTQRRQLAEAMDDERLADVLEELPEEEQVRIVEGLDRDRLVGVFDEMELDDLADLLGEMSTAQQEQMLQFMDEDDADTLRRLLSYEEGTAGGMMTPEVVIFGSNDTVAEALARIRDPDLVVSIAGQVFITQAPYTAPTGKFLGVVHVQRLLREPPSMQLGRLLRDVPIVSPDASDREVAEQLASYDLLAVPVCDEAGRLLGAVTVDDVIDRMLGEGWRDRPRARPATATTTGRAS